MSTFRDLIKNELIQQERSNIIFDSSYFHDSDEDTNSDVEQLEEYKENEETLIDIRFRVYWFEIHSFAIQTQAKDKILFDKYIENLSTRFFCLRCRYHFREYITENPPSEEHDAFVWSWKFHNAVNKRIGKEEISFDRAISEWSNGANIACEKCG